MRGVRGCGESAGADEEGPNEVGGGRLPDLPAAYAARGKAFDVPALLREVGVQWLHLGNSETRLVGLSILPVTSFQ